MTDPDHLISIKNRPEQSSEKSEIPAQPFEITSSRQFQVYLNLKANYLKNEFSQNLRNMIRKSLVLLQGLNKDLKITLENFLESFVIEMLISELELVAFSLLIEKYEYLERYIEPSEFIKLCLYLSKLQLENNKEALKTVGDSLKAQFRNFEKSLNVLSQGSFLTVLELNKRFTQLSTSREKELGCDIRKEDILKTRAEVSNKKKYISVKVDEFIEEKTNKKHKKKDSEQPELEDKNKDLHWMDIYSVLPLDENDMYLLENSPEQMRPESHPFGFLDEMSVDLESEDDLDSY